MIESIQLKSILEAVLFSAAKPLSIDKLLSVFSENERPDVDLIKKVLVDLQESYEGRAIALVEVASGYRFQVNPQWAPWVGLLWEEKATRYSRALLETLSLIAYRQPITRGEIESIRGVAVSTSIIKTLLEEREWVRVVGHKEAPGRPALYATTKNFLDYFGLKSLDQLPSLPDVLNLESKELAAQLTEVMIQECNNETESAPEISPEFASESESEPEQEFEFELTTEACTESE